MKSRLSALATICLVLACDGATAPRSVQSTVDDSRVPAELRAAYYDDAARLALRDLLAVGFSGIRIPGEAIRPYYNALVLVYNAGALPARDTVVDVYAIHTFVQPATRELYLLVADNQRWAQRLAHDSLPTGNASIDQLLEEYGLSFDRLHVLTGQLLIVLRSAAPLSMTGLASRFAGISGVRAGPNGWWGDGNDIEGSHNDVTHVDYSVGYGDCPAGCINRRFYHFAVRDDGTVDFLGASGSPPPRPGQP